MSAWELPVDVSICGQLFAIRSDFRAVLDALAALQDEALSEQERCMAFLQIMYPAWQRLPDGNEAMRAACDFINLGERVPENQAPKPVLVDWEQDVRIMAPAIDKVLGYSCRRCEYLHWWDFVGAYMGIGDGLFAQVVNIRSKRAKGKTLDKAEQEFARENAELIGKTAPKLSAAEEEFFKGLGV